eukprot:470504-Prymnesium_polylepis.1
MPHQVARASRPLPPQLQCLRLLHWAEAREDAHPPPCHAWPPQPQWTETAVCWLRLPIVSQAPLTCGHCDRGHRRRCSCPYQPCHPRRARWH